MGTPMIILLVTVLLGGFVIYSAVLISAAYHEDLSHSMYMWDVKV